MPFQFEQLLEGETESLHQLLPSRRVGKGPQTVDQIREMASAQSQAPRPSVLAEPALGQFFRQPLVSDADSHFAYPISETFVVQGIVGLIYDKVIPFVSRLAVRHVDRQADRAIEQIGTDCERRGLLSQSPLQHHPGKLPANDFVSLQRQGSGLLEEFLRKIQDRIPVLLRP